ncbi:MAG: hypothetical protein IJ317_02150 [Clostridia bacterium]|nr:hypothetical protein [Clostridia bacterium]
MKFISKQKYLNAAIMYAVMFVFSIALGVIIGVLKNNTLTGLYIGAALGVFFLVPSAAYLIGMSVNGKKAAALYETEEKKTAKVTAFKAGIFKGLACITVKMKNTEYSSPYYFWATEAQELVGGEVTFCVIKEKIYVYSMKKNPNAQNIGYRNSVRRDGGDHGDGRKK